MGGFLRKRKNMSKRPPKTPRTLAISHKSVVGPLEMSAKALERRLKTWNPVYSRRKSLEIDRRIHLARKAAIPEFVDGVSR